MIRIGVDFGGSKIEAAALDDTGAVVARARRATPAGYEEAIDVVSAVVCDVEAQAQIAKVERIGVGMPGSISPRTGRVRNANTAWLNGRPFAEDLSAASGRALRLANDANCFALSEAIDGAGAGALTVFGVILGTGCGGGLVVDARLIAGVNGIAGEIGHTPLPWPSALERGSRRCWCGKSDCLETWISGSAFVADYQAATGERLDGASIMGRVRAGEANAEAVFERYLDRLGRALAMLCNLIDPDVIVLGGGMSNTPELYLRAPDVLRRWIFSDVLDTHVVQAAHGDSSGVRGAAWLWPAEP